MIKGYGSIAAEKNINFAQKKNGLLKPVYGLNYTIASLLWLNKCVS